MSSLSPTEMIHSLCETPVQFNDRHHRAAIRGDDRELLLPLAEAASSRRDDIMILSSRTSDIFLPLRASVARL